MFDDRKRGIEISVAVAAVTAAAAALERVSQRLRLFSERFGLS